MSFLLGLPIFRGYVKFPGCISAVISNPSQLIFVRRFVSKNVVPATNEKPLLSTMLKHHKRITSTVEIKQKWHVVVKMGCFTLRYNSTASEWCCTQNSSKNNPNQPSLAFVFGVLRCLDVYFVYSTLLKPRLHVALGVSTRQTRRLEMNIKAFPTTRPLRVAPGWSRFPDGNPVDGIIPWVSRINGSNPKNSRRWELGWFPGVQRGDSLEDSILSFGGVVNGLFHLVING